MIVGFSTSSRLSSVAVFEASGEIVWSGREEAPHAAGGACLRMLEASGVELAKVELFLADLGPGSFTGVRVGVTLAKTFGYAMGVDVGGFDAFDLIDPRSVVVLPSKRGEWFIRRPGMEAIRSGTLPADPYVGFGPEIEPSILPDAVRFAALIDRVQRMRPELLMPSYRIEPSISLPKKPYGVTHAT